MKICQHMYEAAEIDLQKAVEEEEQDEAKKIKGAYVGYIIYRYQGIIYRQVIYRLIIYR